MVSVVSVVSWMPFDPLFRFRPYFRPHFRPHVRPHVCFVLLGVRLYDVCCVVRCGVRFRVPCFVRYRCVR